MIADQRAVETAAACIDALRLAGATVSTAESLTGGLVCATLAAVPGASDVLRGGVTAYASDVKTGLLGVPEETVATHGTVSAECASAMAHGARRVLGATWAVSTTGVAGPTEQEGKPVGTVYVAVLGPGVDAVTAPAVAGARAEIVAETVAAGLDLLLAQLSRAVRGAG